MDGLLQIQAGVNIVFYVLAIISLWVRLVEGILAQDEQRFVNTVIWVLSLAGSLKIIFDILFHIRII